MTTPEKIKTLNWFDFLRKIKEILLEIFNGGGESGIAIHIVETGNFTVPDTAKTRMITLSSELPQDVILPEILIARTSIYFITNDSSSTVNIKSRTGSNDIWDSMFLVNDKMVDSGTTMRIINDGVNYKIL